MTSTISDDFLLDFKPTETNVTYALLGGFTMVFGLVSQFIRLKAYLSQIFLATVCGIIFGPQVANLVNPLEWDEDFSIVLEFARITLVVQVMTSGLELPTTYVAKKWQSLTILVFPVLGLMWAITTGLIYAIMPFSFLTSLLIAACLTPTDPVLSHSVIKGEFSAEHVPHHLRRIISAESAINDGSAFPFVYLPIFLLETGGRYSFAERWLLEVWLWEVVFGCLVGGALGWLSARFLEVAVKKKLMEKESILAFSIALAFFVLGITEILGTDSILAVFIAGSVFSGNETMAEFIHDEKLQEFIDTTDLIVSNVFFLYFGTIIPWDAWNALSGWKLFLVCLSILLLRRLPPVLLLYRVIPAIKNVWEAIFVGWFGPMGVAALFYAVVILHELDDRTAFDVVSVVVFSSIIAHGITTVPLTIPLTTRHTRDEVKPVTESFRPRFNRRRGSGSTAEVVGNGAGGLDSGIAHSPSVVMGEMGVFRPVGASQGASNAPRVPGVVELAPTIG
eukprot:GILJ01011375.1.p1 GENE.GILJ01011375.1~~GILJ01011375.1.p1  ORF type:complete len:506 (+),score=38.47 GILJ01011375.1:67-1584(+)